MASVRGQDDGAQPINDWAFDPRSSTVCRFRLLPVWSGVIEIPAIMTSLEHSLTVRLLSIIPFSFVLLAS